MLAKLWSAFKNKFIFAIRGIWITFREEKSLWSHLIVSLIVIGFGYWLKINYIEWCILVICIAAVMGFEVINTAIEAMVDMVSYQYNLKAKKIKDIAAGATLLISVASAIVGLIIFIPKIIAII